MYSFYESDEILIMWNQPISFNSCKRIFKTRTAFHLQSKEERIMKVLIKILV